MRTRPLTLLLVAVLLLASALPLVRNSFAQTASGRATVSNDQSNHAATGSILDDSGWPTIPVRITNEHDFWLKIDIVDNLSVTYDDANPWAKFGYIPPQSSADYTLRFDPKRGSHIQFFVNAGRTKDGTGSAAYITALQRTIDTALTYLGSKKDFQDADAQQLLNAIDQWNHLPDCVDAVNGVLNGDPAEALQFTARFTKCLTDPEEAAILASITSEYGVSVTADTLTDKVFTPLKLPELIGQVSDNLLAIITGSWAGSIIFTSVIPISPSVSSTPAAASGPEATISALQTQVAALQSPTQAPASPSQASMPLSVKMIDLGSIGPNQIDTRLSINNGGQVVGGMDDPERHLLRAALWQKGKATDLVSLSEEDNSYAASINQAGQIVGWSGTSDGDQHAVLWQDGQITDLGTFVGQASKPSGGAYDINEAGQIVGAAQNHAALWQNGQITDLGTLGGHDSVAFAINDSGQIVGMANVFVGDLTEVGHAAIWQNGQITDLRTLGGQGSVAYDINDQGQIVGIAATSDGHEHAVIWQNGQIADLGSTGSDSAAFGINGAGQIAGAVKTADGNWHAVLWQDGQSIELGTLGGPNSIASGINDVGQIVGTSDAQDGQVHAVLWNVGSVPDESQVVSASPVPATPAATGVVASPASSLSIDEVVGRAQAAIKQAGTWHSQFFLMDGANRTLESLSEVDIAKGIKTQTADGEDTEYCNHDRLYRLSEGTWMNYAPPHGCDGPLLGFLQTSATDWTLVRTETIDGLPAYVVDRTSVDPVNLKETLWIDTSTFLPIKREVQGPTGGDQVNSYEQVFSDFGQPVDVQPPPEAFAPTPTPSPSPSAATLDALAAMSPDAAYNLLLTSSFSNDEAPPGFTVEEEGPSPSDAQMSGLEQDLVGIFRVNLQPGQNGQPNINYAVYPSVEVAKERFEAAVAMAQRVGYQSSTPPGFQYPATCLSVVQSPAAAGVCFVQVGNILILGFSVLPGASQQDQALTNALDLARAGVQHLEKVITNSAVVPTIEAVIASAAPASTSDRSMVSQSAVDTTPLLDLLPNASQAPQGLALTNEAERSKSDVVASMGGTDEAAQMLDDWGWQGNAYREFTAPADNTLPPGSVTYLNVALHRFGSPDAADNALTYFSDYVVTTQGLQDAQIAPVGDAARGLTGAPDGNALAVLYVRSGSLLYRIGTSTNSADGDPMAAAVAVAKAIIGG